MYAKQRFLTSIESSEEGVESVTWTVMMGVVEQETDESMRRAELSRR